MWKVVLNKLVQRKLSRIPNPDKARIKQAICALEDRHETLDIRPLVGRSGYRLKVGGWRLLLDIDYEERTIFVYMLASHGDVYKK